MRPDKRYFLILINLVLWLLHSHASGISGYKGTFKSATDSIDNVFIRVVSSKQVAYTGEAFIVKYLLYNAVSVIDPQTEIEVKFKDCYQEPYLADQQQITEKINGKLYNVTELKRYLVIAANAGKLVLPRLKIHIKVNSPVINDFFGQEKLITKALYSDAADVMIHGLPARLDTIQFSGAVGSFEIKGGYKPSAKIPNLLLFHLTIDGTGNTKAAAFVAPPLPEGSEIYNTTLTRKDTLAPDGIKTHLDYSFQVVANYRGQFIIQPVIFSFFDPEKNKYENFTSGACWWRVNKGPLLSLLTNSVHKQPTGIYIKKSLYDNTGAIYSYSPSYYFLLIIGLLLYLYSYKMLYFNKLAENYLERINSNKARDRAFKNIKKLMTASSALDDDIFNKKIIAIFHQYVQEKSNRTGNDISGLLFENNRVYKNLPASVYEQLITFLINQYSLRFGAVKVEGFNKLQRCNQLIIVVKAIDSNWNE